MMSGVAGELQTRARTTVKERALNDTAPVRLIALYLPQYHPIPENDRWWGKGFTEWTHVASSRPRFRGHYQPHVPADLGFYDLRLSEVRAAQAELARSHGIYGFCYYHYWFHGGKLLLDLPFREVLESGVPDFPFCLCWANEPWTRSWAGRPDETLAPAGYSREDDRCHIRWLTRAFTDKRYIRVSGKPLFLVYRACNIPNTASTLAFWREEFNKHGIDGVYVCKVERYQSDCCDPALDGFDAAVEFAPDWGCLPPPHPYSRFRSWLRTLGVSRRGYPFIFEYAPLARNMMAKPHPGYVRFPCVTPSWDNTARHRENGVIFKGSSPDLYYEWLSSAVWRQAIEPEEHRVVFVNAWNEWAEGCHLEPDLRYGDAYLRATRRALAL